MLAWLTVVAAVGVGVAPTARSDHLLTQTDGLIDSRCDNHSCDQVRLDDEVAEGGNPFNQLDTIEVPGNAGQGLPDRLTWGGQSVCVENFVAPGCAAGGDITDVTAGAGLSGGATFGGATLSLADGGVTTTKIADGAVVTLKLADASVITAKLVDASVTTPKLAANAVDAAKLSSSATVDTSRAVTTNHVRDGAVTTAKLADGAVVTLKLADGSVATAKLVDLSVTTPKLADNAVDAAKLSSSATVDANRAVTTNHLRDGAITSVKILDGTIAIGDLAFDPGTQAELDAHKAGGDHDSRYFTESELQTAGAINTAGNPVDWSRLKGVPASLADGVDADSGGDITSVSAGSGLSGGGTSGDVTLSVNTATIQSRVTASCSVGSTIRVINADGTVVCEPSGPAQMVSGVFALTNGGPHFSHPMDRTQTANLAESETEMLITRAATLENFRCRVTSGLSGGHTTDITIRKNGADTAMSVSFVAGDGAGTQKTDADTVSVAAGDRIAIKIVNSVGGSGGPPVSWAFDLS